MRFVPSALFALLTFALSVHSMPLTTSPSHLDAPASSKLGKYCTASTQCNSSTLFCNRNKCDTLRTISQSCYKDNGCTTKKCLRSRCVATSPRANGKWCNDAAQCTSRYCNASNACATPLPPPKLKNGAACKQSTACSSGLCEYSRCASKKQNGKPCYKDVACLSGFCKDQKTCANKTPSPTTTASTPAPTDSNEKEEKYGFDDGSFGSITTSGDVRIVTAPGQAHTGSSYARLTATSTTPAQLTQDYSGHGSTKRRRANVGNHRRQSTTESWPQLDFWFYVATFDAGPNAGSCKIEAMHNGLPASRSTFRSTTTIQVWNQMTHQYKSTVVTWGILVSCTEGASAQVRIDDIVFTKPVGSEDGGSPTATVTTTVSATTATVTGTTVPATPQNTRVPDNYGYPGTDIPLISDAENLIEDSSFELSPSEWSQTDRAAVFESTKSHTGSHHIEITPPRGGGNGGSAYSWTGEKIDNDGVTFDAEGNPTNIVGYTFQASAWWRVEPFEIVPGAIPDPPLSDPYCIFWFHVQGMTIFKSKFYSTLGVSEWKQVGATIQWDIENRIMDSGAVLLSVDCYSGGAGTVWVDDVRVSEKVRLATRGLVTG
ncbi:hypothetical protein ACQY0O_004766 [Thecaphora frezii]